MVFLFEDQYFEILSVFRSNFHRYFNRVFNFTVSYIYGIRFLDKSYEFITGARKEWEKNETPELKEKFFFTDGSKTVRSSGVRIYSYQAADYLLAWGVYLGKIYAKNKVLRKEICISRWPQSSIKHIQTCTGMCSCDTE